MFEKTKEEAIELCIDYVKDVMIKKCEQEPEFAKYHYEHIQDCLEYIKNMVNDPEQIYIDITGNNIVNDMKLSIFTKKQSHD